MENNTQGNTLERNVDRISNSHPKGTPTLEKTMSQLVIESTTMLNFELLQGLMWITVGLFASFGLVIFRYKMGSNAQVGIMTAIVTMSMIQIWAAISTSLSTWGIGGSIDFFLILQATKIYFILVLIHQAYNWYVKRFRPDINRYSYSLGESWLYLPVLSKLNGWNLPSISLNDWQHYGEPLLAIAVGMVLKSLFGLDLGIILIVSGIGLWKIQSIQKSNFLRSITAMKDAEIIQVSLDQALTSKGESHNQFGVNMASSHVVINELKRVHNTKKPDDRLEQLKKQQEL